MNQIGPALLSARAAAPWAPVPAPAPAPAPAVHPPVHPPPSVGPPAEAHDGHHTWALAIALGAVAIGAVLGLCRWTLALIRRQGVPIRD